MEYLDYTGDPRAFLIHEGNKNSGRYPRGSGDRPFQHVGGHFGKRKYQNPDGTLTAKGMERFESEKRRNALKKKDNRVKDEDDLRDPDRWVTEDMESAVNASKAAEGLVGELQKLELKRRPKIDLSSMTDQELRDRINRMNMEAQYERLAAERDPSPVSKGREYIREALQTAGTVLSVGTSALTLALAIKKLS